MAAPPMNMRRIRKMRMKLITEKRPVISLKCSAIVSTKVVGITVVEAGEMVKAAEVKAVKRRLLP